jgi:branched-chain amino acid transport system permease protein
MTAQFTPRNIMVLALLLLLALVPVYCAATGNYFLMSLFTRILILAMAAVSLNLIMGFGGMVSFGHAAYLGIGGYAVGILAKEGINSGFIQWPVALIASGLFALGVGALSLRTRGVYFIMITLAFAQMVYYVAIGLDRYGGDDGLTIYKRSRFFDPIDLSNRTQFYYACFALLLLAVYVICGLAGALLANHTNFISPAMMFWTRSGDLIVMAVLGGMGTVFGPVIGAVALLVLEEALPLLIDLSSRMLVGHEVQGAGEYWQLILGPMLLLIVLFARGGIDGLLARPRQSQSHG